MRQNDLANIWFRKSYNDVITANHLLYDVYPKQIENSCYHSQQAVEKALKAYLQYMNEEAPYTHDLALLCQLCAEKNEVFNAYLDDCADLTQYATRTRYPDETDITEHETGIALTKARTMYACIYELLGCIDIKYRID